jgi:hypothetical protein
MGLLCVIASFRREVGVNCALLDYYTASRGNSFPTFLDKNPRTLEYGTDRMYQDVGKELPLLAE